MPRLHWPRSQNCLGTRNNLRASAHSADTPGAFARARGRDGAGTGQPVPVSSATTASRSAADAVRAVASCASNASTNAISSSTFATIRRCSARGGMGSIKSRMLFPLVPKFHLGTHLAAKLRFAMASNGGRCGEPAERQSEALHTSPFPSETWERGGNARSRRVSWGFPECQARAWRSQGAATGRTSQDRRAPAIPRLQRVPCLERTDNRRSAHPGIARL